MKEALEELLATIKQESYKEVEFQFKYYGRKNRFNVIVIDKDGISSLYKNDKDIPNIIYDRLAIEKATQWVVNKRRELTTPKTRLIHGIEIENLSRSIRPMKGTSYLYPDISTINTFGLAKWEGSKEDEYRLAHGLVYMTGGKSREVCKIHSAILLETYKP